MSWKWEMNDHGNWITNSVRFATKKEADDYGFDLSIRWTGMPDPGRSAETDDPVNYVFENGRAVPEKEGT